MVPTELGTFSKCPHDKCMFTRLKNPFAATLSIGTLRVMLCGGGVPDYQGGSLQKPWVLSPEPHKTGVEVQACNPSTYRVEAGRSEVRGQYLLHSRFEVSLAYLRPCLRNAMKDSKMASGAEGLITQVW